MNATLLNLHYGVMAASPVVQAINRIVTSAALLWLTWQIVLCSGLRWRWFHRPLHLGRPVTGFRIGISFMPGAGKWRRLPLLPRRDPYDWACTWLWFQVRWVWIT